MPLASLPLLSFARFLRFGFAQLFSFLCARRRLLSDSFIIISRFFPFVNPLFLLLPLSIPFHSFNAVFSGEVGGFDDSNKKESVHKQKESPEAFTSGLLTVPRIFP
jgi:hypothetical protein